MGWFVGMAFLPLLYKHSVYLSEHNWLPYIVLSAFAIAGGILILCIQKVCLLHLYILNSNNNFFFKKCPFIICLASRKNAKNHPTSICCPPKISTYIIIASL